MFGEIHFASQSLLTENKKTLMGARIQKRNNNDIARQFCDSVNFETYELFKKAPISLELC